MEANSAFIIRKISIPRLELGQVGQVGGLNAGRMVVYSQHGGILVCSILEVFRNRYSCRAYKADPVEEEKLAAILEAGRLAPTAANRQPFRLVVVKTEGRQEELRRIYPKEWFVQAPLILGVCALPDKAWVRRDGKNYADVDVSIVMDHMVLAASAQGLGTCWVGAFDAGITREILGLDKELEPVAFTPLGYPLDAPAAKVRKQLEELVLYR